MAAQERRREGEKEIAREEDEKKEKVRVPEESFISTESEDVESLESVEQEYMAGSEGTHVMDDNQEGLYDDAEIDYDN
uniref:Uncharacterized protein n=1 Tax=Oryza sativa subsp. japonica TaxID=39947 RepID=Q6K7L2_ORYSJ|nr:hypothetical protein [Oryza sativa Japonica Group]